MNVVPAVVIITIIGCALLPIPVRKTSNNLRFGWGVQLIKHDPMRHLPVLRRYIRTQRHIRRPGSDRTRISRFNTSSS